jgi:hypothetical protein
MSPADAYAATPPQNGARAFDAAAGALCGLKARSFEQWRYRHRLPAKVELSTACRWCGGTMTPEWVARVCSRLCRDCCAEAGREASR